MDNKHHGEKKYNENFERLCRLRHFPRLYSLLTNRIKGKVCYRNLRDVILCIYHFSASSFIQILLYQLVTKFSLDLTSILCQITRLYWNSKEYRINIYLCSCTGQIVNNNILRYLAFSSVKSIFYINWTWMITYNISIVHN